MVVVRVRNEGELRFAWVEIDLERDGSSLVYVLDISLSVTAL